MGRRQIQRNHGHSRVIRPSQHQRNIITTDALGIQREIVKKIRQKCADYVLALKGNHPNLFEDAKRYFDDAELLSKCTYMKTTEKTRGGIETCEYWQADDISWLSQKKNWAGLKTIAMTRNTIAKDKAVTTETPYFISGRPFEISEIARAIRGHWMVESYHWHWDVTFHEDDNHTLEKQAAFNQNILRKLALNVMKIFDTGKKNMSLRLKRFKIGTNPEKHPATIASL